MINHLIRALTWVIQRGLVLTLHDCWVKVLALHHFGIRAETNALWRFVERLNFILKMCRIALVIDLDIDGYDLKGIGVGRSEHKILCKEEF